MLWTAFIRTQAVRCGVNGASCISQPSPKYLLSIFSARQWWHTNSNKRRHLRFADNDNNNEWQLNQKKKWRTRSFNQITWNGFFRFLYCICARARCSVAPFYICICSVVPRSFFFSLFPSSFHLFYYHWRDIVFTAVIFMAKHSTNPDRSAFTSGSRQASRCRPYGQHWKIQKGKHNSKKDLIISTVF